VVTETVTTEPADVRWTGPLVTVGVLALVGLVVVGADVRHHADAPRGR
jgi:hypothetical protein